MEERKESRRAEPSQPLHVRYAEVLLRDAYEKKMRGDYPAAVSLFDDLLRRFSQTLERREKSVIHGECALLYFWLGDYESAQTHAERSLAEGENDHAYVVLGKIALARFQFPEARGYFNKVSDENPDKYLGLCLVAIKLRDTKGAIHFLHGAEERKIPRQDPEYRVLAAYCRLLSGGTSSAVSEARELLSKCDKDPLLLLLLAEIFMTAGNYGEASATAQKVSHRCPENDQCYAIFSHAAYAEEEYGLAESAVREALRRNPRNAYAKTILMKLATREANYAYAESIGREILEMCPEYSLGHANLGDVYFNEGRYELAELEYEQTMQLMDSQTKGAQLRKARMKFMREDYAGAAEILEKLIESHHTYYDDAMCDLALCYDKLGDEEKKAEIMDKMEMRKSFYRRTERILKSL